MGDLRELLEKFRGQPLVVRLRLTDDRGGPLCATPPAANIDWEL